MEDTDRIDSEADLVEDLRGEGAEPGPKVVSVQPQHG